MDEGWGLKHAAGAEKLALRHCENRNKLKLSARGIRIRGWAGAQEIHQGEWVDGASANKTCPLFV